MLQRRPCSTSRVCPPPGYIGQQCPLPPACLHQWSNVAAYVPAHTSTQPWCAATCAGINPGCMCVAAALPRRCCRARRPLLQTWGGCRVCWPWSWRRCAATRPPTWWGAAPTGLWSWAGGMHCQQALQCLSGGVRRGEGGLLGAAPQGQVEVGPCGQGSCACCMWWAVFRTVWFARQFWPAAQGSRACFVRHSCGMLCTLLLLVGHVRALRTLCTGVLMLGAQYSTIW
jgi:hypothetical protein